MLCAFCKAHRIDIAWDETSHLGKRPICYECIGKRDLAKMQTHRHYILYLNNNRICNIVNSLSFAIKQQVNKYTHTEFTFLVNKKKWIGVMYSNCDRILCRKFK